LRISAALKVKISSFNRLSLEAAFKLEILDLNAALKVEKYQNTMLNYKTK
jgi:hypothetical protein